MTDHPSDVNERVTEEWKADTTPGERVRTVMKRTYDHQSVATIAERALTSEMTVRKHLEALAEVGFVDAVSPSDERGTCYERAPRSVVFERVQQLLHSADVETLSEGVTELRGTVREFEEQAGVESPRAAAIADAEMDPAAVTEWQTALRNLKLARPLSHSRTRPMSSVPISRYGNPARDVGFTTAGTDG